MHKKELILKKKIKPTLILTKKKDIEIPADIDPRKVALDSYIKKSRKTI